MDTRASERGDLGDNVVREELLVMLHCLVRELTADETLDAGVRGGGGQRRERRMAVEGRVFG